MEPKASRKNYYLSNRDLLVIAILSGIGGVMSTYIGYLGNLLNRIFGVPFGAGQFVSGLHIFWFILVAGLVRRPGAATAAGLLKGIIEMLTGSTHGIAIILVSLTQGLVVDLVLLVIGRRHLASYMLAGGIAAASNVFVFQLLYFSAAPLKYIFFISLIALVSGVLLAGSFGYSVLEVVLQARPFRTSGPVLAEEAGEDRVSPVKTSARSFRLMVTAVLAALLSMGAVYYYAAVFELPWSGPQCQVEGKVENPLSFNLSRFADHETTIKAELKGQVSHIPAQDYTGIPLRVILQQASPQEGATRLTVMATDGYTVEFDLQQVLKDDLLLLTREDNMLRLIAGNYDGGYWVKMVNRMVVE